MFSRYFVIILNMLPGVRLLQKYFEHKRKTLVNV